MLGRQVGHIPKWCELIYFCSSCPTTLAGLICHSSKRQGWEFLFGSVRKCSWLSRHWLSLEHAMPQAPQITSSFSRLRNNGDNQSCLWQKKTFLAEMLSGNFFFRSQWHKEWRKSSGLFPVRAICKMSYSTFSTSHPPQMKWYNLQCVFPDSFFTMQMIYDLGLI